MIQPRANYLNPSLESNCFQHVIDLEITQFLERNSIQYLIT